MIDKKVAYGIYENIIDRLLMVYLLFYKQINSYRFHDRNNYKYSNKFE